MQDMSVVHFGHQTPLEPKMGTYIYGSRNKNDTLTLAKPYHYLTML